MIKTAKAVLVGTTCQIEEEESRETTPTPLPLIRNTTGCASQIRGGFLVIENV